MSLQRIPHDQGKFVHNPVESLNIGNRNRIGGLNPNTKLLITGIGANDSTDIVDLTGKTVARYGDTKITTTNPPFGGSSMVFDGNGDYCTANLATDGDFGTGDYTVDIWLLQTSLADQYALHIPHSGTNTLIDIVSSSRLSAAVGGAGFDITSGITLQAGVWYHIALVRASGVGYVFHNGILKASGAATVNLTGTGLIYLGRDSAGTYQWDGKLAMLRVTKGEALWTSSFTPPQRLAEYYANNYIGI